VSRSPQLTEQLDSADVAAGSERLRATDSKDCDCTQERTELTCCAWIEATVVPVVPVIPVIFRKLLAIMADLLTAGHEQVH
jgi:hypothetical protein